MLPAHRFAAGGDPGWRLADRCGSAAGSLAAARSRFARRAGHPRAARSRPAAGRARRSRSAIGLLGRARCSPFARPGRGSRARQTPRWLARRAGPGAATLWLHRCCSAWPLRLRGSQRSGRSPRPPITLFGVLYTGGPAAFSAPHPARRPSGDAPGPAPGWCSFRSSSPGSAIPRRCSAGKLIGGPKLAPGGQPRERPGRAPWPGCSAALLTVPLLDALVFWPRGVALALGQRLLLAGGPRYCGAGRRSCGVAVQARGRAQGFVRR